MLNFLITTMLYEPKSEDRKGSLSRGWFEFRLGVYVRGSECL